jgi:hypothetical protein
MASLETAKSHDLLNNQYKLSDENPSVASGSSYSTQDSGERKLAALGYTQELNRGFSTFTNFAVSFSIISILTGITGNQFQVYACSQLFQHLLCTLLSLLSMHAACLNSNLSPCLIE